MRKRRVFLFFSAALVLLSCQIAYIETATPGPPGQTPSITTAQASIPQTETASYTPFIPTKTPFDPTYTPITPTFTPFVITATFTPFVVTATPLAVCTPPACAENESYFCPGGNCPGGCGTVCATHTPQAGGSWWHPQPGLTFHIQYSGEINLNRPVDIYDLDLFETSPETIGQLHDRGVQVVCYFSAGSYEDWRPDAADFPASVLGSPLEDWEGERWLNIRRIDLLSPIMAARLDLAVLSGCDAVDPDNLDGYTQQTSFKLTAAEQLAYNRWLAKQAHQRGLAIGLKNDLGQIPALLGEFDFAVNEECFFYEECGSLEPFIQQDKAVFGIEYQLDPADFCPQANAAGYSFTLKNLDLDAFADPCWEQ